MAIRNFSDLLDHLGTWAKLLGALLYYAAMLVAGITVTVACFYLWYDSRPSSEEVDRVSLEMYQKMPRPRYFFEPGGQVCFAQFYQERRRWYQFPTGGPVFTRVPCTRAVLDSLENKSSVPDEFIAEDARAPSSPFTLPASP